MALRDLKKYVNIILIAILLSVVFQGAYDTLFYGMKGDNSDAIRSLAAMSLVVIFIIVAILILRVWALVSDIKPKAPPTAKIPEYIKAL
jgi:hypothetical protein